MVGGAIPLTPLSGRKGYQPLDHEERRSSESKAMHSSRATATSSSRKRLGPARRNSQYGPGDNAEDEHLLAGETSADDAEFGDRLDNDAPPQTQLGADGHELNDDSVSVRTVSRTVCIGGIYLTLDPDEISDVRYNDCERQIKDYTIPTFR